METAIGPPLVSDGLLSLSIFLTQAIPVPAHRLVIIQVLVEVLRKSFFNIDRLLIVQAQIIIPILVIARLAPHMLQIADRILDSTDLSVLEG